MENKNIVKEITKPLFEEGIDYTKEDIDRPYRWRLEDGNIIFLNKDQRQFLARNYYNESKRNDREKRCDIPSKRNGMSKKCRGKCSNCLLYQNGISNFGIVSLDYLYEHYKFEPEIEEISLYENMEYKDQLNKIYTAISELENNLDKLIIYFYLDGLTERKIGLLIGMTSPSVHKRKKQIIKKIKEKLKK